MFGDFIKEKRLAQNLSLRSFCKAISEDPSNWSKVERGVLTPPKNEAKLKSIARVLKVKQGSTDWDRLKDLAAVDGGTIPDYIMSDKDLVNMLPAFFRTVGNERPTKEELERLIKVMKGKKK